MKYLKSYLKWIFQLILFTELIKPTARTRMDLSKELSKLPREAVCSAVSSRVRRNCGEKFTSRGREDKIKHVWHFWPRKANSSLIFRIELSLVDQAVDSSSSRWCRRKKFRRHWSHVKNIKHVWFYSHCLVRRISHQNLPAHVGKRLRKPPREAVCLALSSPCAAGLRCLHHTMQNLLQKIPSFSSRMVASWRVQNLQKLSKSNRRQVRRMQMVMPTIMMMMMAI